MSGFGVWGFRGSGVQAFGFLALGWRFKVLGGWDGRGAGSADLCGLLVLLSFAHSFLSRLEGFFLNFEAVRFSGTLNPLGPKKLLPSRA